MALLYAVLRDVHITGACGSVAARGDASDPSHGNAIDRHPRACRGDYRGIVRGLSVSTDAVTQ